MRWRGDWQGALWVNVWWTADLVSPEVFILLHPPSLRLMHSRGGQWSREEPSFKERLDEPMILVKIDEFFDHLKL